MKNKIKKFTIALGAFALLSFTIEKVVTIKFSEDQMNFHWQNLNNIKGIIDQSNLPHAQAKALIFAIDSLQSDINKSYKSDSTMAGTPVKK